MLIRNNYLKVEIADSPSKQSQGLMFRDKLEDDKGMLFVFNRPQNLKFWGLNTYIPLDVAFVSPENEILKISDIKPLDFKKTVTSDFNCDKAIETNLNFFKKNRIEVGDQIEIEKLSDGINLIKFKKKSI